MATRITYTLDDDLDGSPAAETVPFELDGAAYTIDLSAAHAAEFRTALAPFVQAANLAEQRQARRVEQGSARRRSPSRPTRSAGSPAGRPNRAAQQQAVNTAIRVWARGAGYQVSDRGRLKKTIVEEYHLARAGQNSSPQS
ncbi:Lsr2 family protein [Dactylosporangium sp. NPDC051485]|uniref:histone-like nucleoid-structuring protein Lsr2 n=1 Tax=Dactylosporangium sp. NPDC051485 TaxID=3154846 RepID=UPI0034239CC0